MGLTLAGERPDANALPETAAHLRNVPFVPFGEMGSVELAGRIAAALVGDATDPRAAPVAVILERHGAVAVGEAPDRAVDRLELVEVLCRAWRDALLVRAARAVLAESPRPD
jgi:ribulose-5-phosphate 4-epimerase/fuculose-1-phosphate aldolase